MAIEEHWLGIPYALGYGEQALKHLEYNLANHYVVIDIVDYRCRRHFDFMSEPPRTRYELSIRFIGVKLSPEISRITP